MKRAPPAQTVGAVLVPGAVNVLPRVGEAEIPDGRMPDEPGGRCVALWAAVILRAIQDSYGRDLANLQREVDERRPGFYKRTARDWLRRPPPWMLEAAGIEPGAWPIALRHLERKWARVDAAKRQPRDEQRKAA